MIQDCKNYLITNVRIITGKGNVIKNGSILVEKGRIMRIYKDSDKALCNKANCIKIIDAQGKIAGPGLIDMHIHGCGGFDTASVTETNSGKRAIHMEKNIIGITNFLRLHGITSYQLAIVTDINILFAVQDAFLLDDADVVQAEHSKGEQDGKNSKNWRDALVGVYPEGPFINIEKRGGIPPESIEPITLQYIDKLLSFTRPDTTRPLITTMTTAPELSGAEELYTVLKNTGVKIAWGHSAAYIDELPLRKDIHLTHLFNAMTGLDHKKPGLATLPFLKNYNDATFELICDTIHVNSAMLELVFSTLGTERMCLISDGMSRAGMEAGDFDYMGKIAVNDGICCRYKEDDLLIGSSMLISDTARNLFTQGLIDDQGFFRIAAVNPARVLGLQDRGTLEKGKRADIVLVDASMNITDVFCV